MGASRNKRGILAILGIVMLAVLALLLWPGSDSTERGRGDGERLGANERPVAHASALSRAQAQPAVSEPRLADSAPRVRDEEVESKPTEISSAPVSRPEIATKVRVFHPFRDELVSQPRIAIAIDPSGSHTKHDLEWIRRSPNGWPPQRPKVIHLVGQRGFEIVYVRSTDGGSHYSVPRALMTVKGGGKARRGPRIAVSGRVVVVTACEGGGADEQRILGVSSTDSGRTWNDPVAITDRTGVASDLQHDLGVASGIEPLEATGEDRPDFLVAWVDDRDSAGPSIHTSHSKDLGKTWSKNVPVRLPVGATACGGCGISVVGDVASFTVLFRDNWEGARDLRYARTHALNYGAIDSILPVTESRWGITECPGAEGALAPRDSSTVIQNLRGTLELVEHEFDGKILRRVPLGRGGRPTMSTSGFHFLVAFLEGPEHTLAARMLFAGRIDERYQLPELEPGVLADCPHVAFEMPNELLVFEAWKGNRPEVLLYDLSEAHQRAK